MIHRYKGREGEREMEMEKRVKYKISPFYIHPHAIMNTYISYRIFGDEYYSGFTRECWGCAMKRRRL